MNQPIDTISTALLYPSLLLFIKRAYHVWLEGSDRSWIIVEAIPLLEFSHLLISSSRVQFSYF